MIKDREMVTKRWNPIMKYWEYWSTFFDMWIESGIQNRYDVKLKLSYSMIELYYVDTWCEPFEGM